ncbi:MAG: hypothetical protein ABR500_05150 [Dermatophilaceae bacterium]
MRARQLVAPGATVLVAVVVLAGCTGDAGVEPATGSTLTSTPAATPPPTEGEDSTGSAEPGEEATESRAGGEMRLWQVVLEA